MTLVSQRRSWRGGVVKFGLVPKLVILENVNKWITPGNTTFSSYLLAGQGNVGEQPERPVEFCWG